MSHPQKGDSEIVYLKCWVFKVDILKMYMSQLLYVKWGEQDDEFSYII